MFGQVISIYLSLGYLVYFTSVIFFVRDTPPAMSR
jgi:hypothetical protein